MCFRRLTLLFVAIQQGPVCSPDAPPSLRFGPEPESDGSYGSRPNGGGGAGGVAANTEGMTGGHGGSYGTAGELGFSSLRLGSTTRRAPAYGDPGLATLFFGSGGGGGGNSWNSSANPVVQAQPSGYGVGGAGGGLIFISAATLVNQGTITADGANGSNGYLHGAGTCAQAIMGGGGGGGAGGSIRIQAVAGIGGVVSAEGGAGGSAIAYCYQSWTTAPIGGAGGSGRVRVQTGGGFSLAIVDVNTVRLVSSGPTATAQLVVKE